MKKSFTGLLAFFIVLATMPLGHAAMILMEKGFGHEHIYPAAALLGLLGIILLFWGYFSENNTKATILGLAASLFVWTGWVEFGYVYFANRFGVAPLMVDGEIVTKPEYLIMPSSIGFWVVFMLYFLMATSTGCKFFIWLQKVTNLKMKIKQKQPSHPAISTFMETILLLWTFYLVLLFAYDENFLGDRHPVTYIIAFASLLWSAILFFRLLKIKNIGYAIRYAIPTVIIFWNFVEILGRWDLFKEIWVHPTEYWLEMLLTGIVFLSLIVISLVKSKKPKKTT